MNAHCKLVFRNNNCHQYTLLTQGVFIITKVNIVSGFTLLVLSDRKMTSL